MTDHDALLATILAHPDDDLPRLVFADFLEESGDAERAEFIRVQCELARMEPCLLTSVDEGFGPAPCRCGWHGLDRRQRELTAADIGRGRLIGRLPGGLVPKLPGYRSPDRYATARRGFVEAVQIPWAWWLAHADAILAAQPVCTVRLTDWPDLNRVTPGARGRCWLRGRGPGDPDSRPSVRDWPVYEFDAAAFDAADATLALLRSTWPGVAFELPPPDQMYAGFDLVVENLRTFAAAGMVTAEEAARNIRDAFAAVAPTVARAGEALRAALRSADPATVREMVRRGEIGDQAAAMMLAIAAEQEHPGLAGDPGAARPQRVLDARPGPAATAPITTRRASIPRNRDRRRFPRPA